MSETFLIERDDDNRAVVIMTMNRPEAMNSFNIAQFHAMYNGFRNIADDTTVRAIVLTGRGRAFCAGADISEGFGSSGFDTDIEHVDGIPRDTGGMLNLAIASLNIPVIAAINGPAVGVGLTMTLPCDFRIAAKGQKYAFPFVRRGIVFDGVASFYLPKLVGFSKATQWSLTGSYIDPVEALQSGLFTELLEKDEVLPRALTLARDIATNCSPEAVTLNKRLLRATLHGTSSPFEAHMAESAHLNRMFHARDCTEGVNAFLEKRSPTFNDRTTQ